MDSSGWIIFKKCFKWTARNLIPYYTEIMVEKQLNQIVSISHLFKNADSLRKWREFFKKVNKPQQPVSSVWTFSILPRQLPDNPQRRLDVIPEVIQLIQKETEIPRVCP